VEEDIYSKEEYVREYPIMLVFTVFFVNFVIPKSAK